MFALIGVLVIVVSAFTVAAIHEYVPNKILAVVLQLVLLAAAIGIFIWLRQSNGLCLTQKWPWIRFGCLGLLS